MMSFEQSRGMILSAVGPLEAEAVEILEAGGRISAEDVIAPHSLPRFDNSAIDGHGTRDITHTWPVRSKQSGKMFLRHGQHMRIQSVLTHEQPTREPLVEAVQTVACGRLGKLHTMDQSIPREQNPELGS